MSDFELVQPFIEAATRCRDGAQLQELLGDITKRLRFDYFALVHHVDLRQRGTHQIVAMWTYPDSWVEEYLARRLGTQDPVHLASHRTNVGFAWNELPHLIALTSEHRRVREQTRRAGITDGFTVPANIPGESNGSCSFAVGRGRELPTDALAVAHLVGAFAFQAARRLVQRHDSKEPVRPHLTPRQRECLILMARGSSDRDTGRSLGLAPTTVKEYIDDARVRYDVDRRTQLALRAIWDGQITLSDMIA